MDSMLFFIIGALFVVIVVEFFFMQWMVDQEKKEKKTLLDQLQAQNRALISKNANDYVMTTSIDKVMTEEKAEKPEEEIQEEQLSDDQWYKRMGIKEPENPAN